MSRHAQRVFWPRLIVFLFALVMLIPFLWLITSALKDKGQFFANPPVLIPIPAAWSNFSDVFARTSFLVSIGNTVLYAVGLTLPVLLTSSIVAFGFSRFAFPGRDFVFSVLLATMMIPNQIMTVPLFVLFRDLHWLNTMLPLVVPSAFGVAYHIFLIRQFMNSIPREVDEAAMIDGCGPLSLLFRIILPLCKPVLVVSAIFNSLFAWKDVWFSGIFLQTAETQTVAVRLLAFIGDRDIEYGQMMAASAAVLLPIVIVYFLLQRSFDGGLQIVENK